MNTSSINFNAAFENQELKEAAIAMRDWLKNHPELAFFTYEQVCKALAKSAPFEHFNRVLVRLVAAGELEVKYRVRIREGEYSEEAYDSLEDIPETVFDSAFEPHEVLDDDKVPAYANAR